MIWRFNTTASQYELVFPFPQFTITAVAREESGWHSYQIFFNLDIDVLVSQPASTKSLESAKRAAEQHVKQLIKILGVTQ